MDTTTEQSFLAKIRDELSPKILLPALVGGSIVALFEVVLAVSFAALIFTGPLTPFVANGIGLALLGSYWQPGGQYFDYSRCQHRIAFVKCGWIRAQHG